MSYQQPNAQINVEQIIESLERRWLDSATLPALPVWGQLDATTFYRVLAQSSFWGASQETSRPIDYEQYMEDLVSGVHGVGMPFVYLIIGGAKSVAVYVGMQGTGVDTLLRTSLEGTFPGIELAAQPESRLGSARKDTPLFAHYGRLTGIPTRKAGQPDSAPGKASGLRKGSNAEQIERLLRGLYGRTWGYLVRAAPVPGPQVVAQAQAGFVQITAAKNLVHWQFNRQAQTMRTVSNVEQQSISETHSYDQTNRQAEYCVELLERQLERLNRGKAQGMWNVDVVFFAADLATLGKARTLLQATFSGADSVPDPIRTVACGPGGGGGSTPPEGFATLLNSSELATLCQLSKEEFPGYAVRDYARFDTDLGASSHVTAPIPIGKVMDGTRPTGDWLVMDALDLAKHGLVAGVTGSGKTNTIFHLLDKLWAGGRGAPFLVIEPAKAEYRHLRSVAGLEHLRVYTLGDETVSPLRLNPFEFEINPQGRIHVQTHIDYLKSVFNAAFILYAPMPYVLETCLHEIYQDKGWDLTGGENRRIVPAQRSMISDYPVFPTLSDLYRKIDEVVDRLGYEERIQMDVKAGLKARIGSLRLGSKGLMLDTPRGVPFSQILSQPTVLELERMGNDDEKAFLIGILLTRLYEYRLVEARAARPAQARLWHVVVLEEAHRLLKNVPTEVGTEEANTKGHAVETFSNMLSEIRAYGQGVLIAEQIPTKLAPDAIKNTNLKLAHRIVAEDDRQVLGATMNLDDAQKSYISTLRAGQVVAYAEGADRPYLLSIPDFKGQSLKRAVTDAELAQEATIWRGAPPYTPALLARHVPTELRTSDVRDYVLGMLALPDFPAAFNRYFLSLVASPRLAVYGYNDLGQVIKRALQPRSDPEARAAATWAIVQAASDLLHDRGRRYAWFYHSVHEMLETLVGALADVAARFDNQVATLDALAAKHAPALGLFCKRYLNLVGRAPGPYSGCDFCPAQCRYRFEVAPLAADKSIQREFVAAIQQTKDDNAMWSKLASAARDAAKQVISEQAGQAALHGVAICVAAQIGPQLAFAGESQRKMVKNVKTVLG
jgi:DNA helicase HerA-like ATPase